MSLLSGKKNNLIVTVQGRSPTTSESSEFLHTHIFRGQESDAVAGLPDLSLPSKESNRARATGTDGKNCLDKSGVINQNEPATTGKTNPDINTKTPFSKANGRIRTVNPWFTKPELYH